MKYYTIPCKPILSEYLRFFWVLEHDDVGVSNPYIHRSMADGCCELVFHYKGHFNDIAADGTQSLSFTSGVGGPAQTYSRFYTQDAFGIFGVYLYPHAIAALFGIPASAIVNQQIHLSELLGQAGKDIEAQIMLASTHIKRVEILTAFFESQLAHRRQRSPAVFSAIRCLIQNKGMLKINVLAEEHALSRRQFERNFKEFAGFSPKLYARIIRFQAAIEKYQGDYHSLTNIAYTCGYYDQSHFIHDFKAFSGYHPKTYFNGNNEGTDWKAAK